MVLPAAFATVERFRFAIAAGAIFLNADVNAFPVPFKGLIL